MSEVRSSARPDPTTALVVLGGLGALWLRIRILETPDATRAWLLVAVLSSILVSALLVPVVTDRPHLAPWFVTAVGLSAVGLAGVVAGRPVPATFDVRAIALSLLAAVAEEALFRRAAYGWLERWGPAVAVCGSALLFALIHVPLYGVLAFPVDLGAGLLFSWQRWAAGTWTVPAATHAAANLLAVVMR